MMTIIDNINNGQIDRPKGTLGFSVDTVDLTVLPGQIAEGSFSVLAPSGELNEGYVYSDDYRMECITESFQGSQDEIAYRFHAGNLLPGTEVHGSFILITNHGEYRIPFNVHTESYIIRSSIGPIRNLMHFTNLAKSGWDEAVDIFYDPEFIHMLGGTDKEYITDYKCLSADRGSAHNVDEFLVAIGKKTPVEYIPSEKSVEINDPDGVARYSVYVTRNGWGYTQFETDCEGDFLHVEESVVTGEDFLGNKYQLYYYVDADKLHKGHNFGAIIIRTDRTKTVIPITVNVGGSIRHLKDMTRFRHKKIISLMELYSDHRLKKISTRNWLAESTKVVEDMMANDPEDLMAGLYQIHLLITREHINEAAWNLKKIANQAASVKEEYSYLWCYYLYLNSLVDEDPIDIRTLASEVEYFYRSEPQNWRLCWLLAVMSEEYSAPQPKMELFRQAFERGCNSPAIYVEAARLVLDNPTLIEELDGFNSAVIRYLCKKEMMTAELVFVIRACAERFKEYSPGLIRLLEASYQSFPDEELLSVICAQLIKGNCTDHNAHIWYGYGVEASLKLIRLFEYYMMSIEKSEDTVIPRSVLMYFSFQSDLDYESSAFLYAYIIRHRDEDAEMYSRYERQIGEFVRDQLKGGHNNRYLAVLYKYCIDDEMLADEDVAAGLADVIFMHEIDTSLYPKAEYINLAYDFRDEVERYPIRDNVALVPIYSDRYSFSVENGDGSCHLGDRQQMVVRLIPPGRLLLNLQILVRDHTGIDADYCMKQRDYINIRPENEFRYLSLLGKRYFSADFTRQIMMNLIRFYHDRDRIDNLERVLEHIEISDIPDGDRAESIRYLADCSLYSKSMDWIYDFGPEGLEKPIIAQILHGWLPLYFDDPEKYTGLACQLLLDTIDSGYVGDPAIEFLIRHFKGSVQTLWQIWEKAVELNVGTGTLEERIISQHLFCRAYMRGYTEILKSYAYGSPDGEILKAALAERAYTYFVKDEDIDRTVMEVLTDAYETGLELDRICDLAYVRYYAANRAYIDDKIKGTLKDCLHRLLADNCVLASFKDLSYIMPSMSGYADMEIVEYRTSSDRQINIHYLTEEGESDDYTQEPMNRIYKGVYSKIFVVFFGETIDYYITEDTEEGESEFAVSGKIRRGDMTGGDSQDRFGIIDEMCMNLALKDYEAIDSSLERYYMLDYITDRIFGMRRSVHSDE